MTDMEKYLFLIVAISAVTNWALIFVLVLEIRQSKKSVVGRIKTAIGIREKAYCPHEDEKKLFYGEVESIPEFE